jgi:hypothetical protein
MSDSRKARLNVIDDILESDETVTAEVLALLFDHGGGLKKREAEGWLVLTNRRLVFGTAKHGILIDLPMKEIMVPATIKDKFMSTCLLVKGENGAGHTFVVNRSAAREIARSVNDAGAK